jgi:hypothetical protein
MRWIGHRLHADAELDIDPATTLNDAHRIAHEAEHTLTHAVPPSSAPYTPTRRTAGPISELCKGAYHPPSAAVVRQPSALANVANLLTCCFATPNAANATNTPKSTRSHRVGRYGTRAPSSLTHARRRYYLSP